MPAVFHEIVRSLDEDCIVAKVLGSCVLNGVMNEAGAAIAIVSGTTFAV